MTTDPNVVLRAANPAPTAAVYSDARATALLDRAVGGPSPAPGRRRVKRATATAVAGAFLALGSGGLAWAVLGQPASDTLTVLCSAGTDRSQHDPAAPSGVSLSSRTGDPVADCAEEYQRLEGAAPALVGYATGDTYVAVMPTGWPVPAGWTSLPADFRNDPARLELQQRLDDLVEGPQSRCTTAAEAEAIARAELADLALTGWTFEWLDQAARADGEGWCAIAWVDDGAMPKIVVQAIEGGFWNTEGDDPLRRVADRLRAGIADDCVALPAAQKVVEDALVGNGLAVADADITPIADPAARCTRVDWVPGGRTVVVLRGPSA